MKDKKYKKECIFCKKEYITSHNESLYCSRSCAARSKFKEDSNIYKNGFDEINSYIFGLIMADGCLYYCNHSKREKINICLKDREMIEKIKLYIKSPRSVYKQKGCFTKNFVNQDSINFLKNHGLCYRKSLVADFPKDASISIRDFIRGFFDGDGSVFINKIGKYNYIHIAFTCGSLKFIEKLQQKLALENIKSHICTDKRSKKKNNIIYYLKIYGKTDVNNFFEYIYNGCNQDFKLQRKYDKFIKDDIFCPIPKGIEV